MAVYVNEGTTVFQGDEVLSPNTTRVSDIFSTTLISKLVGGVKGDAGTLTIEESIVQAQTNPQGGQQPQSEPAYAWDQTLQVPVVATLTKINQTLSGQRFRVKVTNTGAVPARITWFIQGRAL